MGKTAQQLIEENIRFFEAHNLKTQREQSDAILAHRMMNKRGEVCEICQKVGA